MVSPSHTPGWAQARRKKSTPSSRAQLTLPLSYLPLTYTEFPFKVCVILWPFKSLNTSPLFPSTLPHFRLGSPPLPWGISPLSGALPFPCNATPILSCLPCQFPFSVTALQQTTLSAHQARPQASLPPLLRLCPRIPAVPNVDTPQPLPGPPSSPTPRQFTHRRPEQVVQTKLPTVIST